MHERLAGDPIWIGTDALSGSREGALAPARTDTGLKRALDLAIALPLAVLLAPILAIIALWIALDSSGPVFFRQTRRGLGGKPFDILKFRTMTVLENGTTIVQATENDPRITRAGRFLRTSSLDELPQLLNVIAGEMSLVGPRPHALAHDEHYAGLIEGYNLRQTVKPGITGWAQVNGLRGETPTLDSMKHRVVFDVWYAANASLALDLEILVRTPLEVLRPEERPLMRPAVKTDWGRRRASYRNYREVQVGGIRTACVSRAQLTQLMVGDCLAARSYERKPRLIFASNGHAIAMAATDARFRRTFDSATLIHADGQPVVFASKAFTHSPIPERSATTDFIHDAAAAARDTGLRFYLLGATEQVNADCAAQLAKDYEGLSIAGRRNGYFGEGDEAAICDAINASGADVLWVGLGVPLEYEFCIRNKHRLKVGWIVTAGGCFNFVTGEYRRAPNWMQAAGLEWLYRLWREPRRLFWRYAVTNPRALFTLLTRTTSFDEA